MRDMAQACCPSRPRATASPSRAAGTRRRGAGLTGVLVADYALFHLEADLRWIDMTAAGLGQFAKEITR
jgi:hypothetical protein